MSERAGLLWSHSWPWKVGSFFWVGVADVRMGFRVKMLLHGRLHLHSCISLVLDLYTSVV